MNKLEPHRQRFVLSLLLEGCSLRATARLTGVHRTTIMKLLVRAGQHCVDLMDTHLRNLRCPVVEADEIWTFVRKKQRRLSTVEQLDREVGDQYAFVAFDPRSKLIIAHTVGKRDAGTTTTLLEQIQSRVPGRIQFFTDGYQEYIRAIDGLYGQQIDYAQVIKPLRPERHGERGSLEIIVWFGRPDLDLIGTAYVERNNLTIRQQVRRFTRMTLGFSKKLQNLRAAVALYFAWYNFVRIHGSLRVTPAMAAGVSETVWDLDQLLP